MFLNLIDMDGKDNSGVIPYGINARDLVERLAKEFFDENMSGEPLTERSVIEGMVDFLFSFLTDNKTIFDNE